MRNHGFRAYLRIYTAHVETSIDPRTGNYAFALSGRKFPGAAPPGRCPGLGAFGLSARPGQRENTQRATGRNRPALTIASDTTSTQPTAEIGLKAQQALSPGQSEAAPWVTHTPHKPRALKGQKHKGGIGISHAKHRETPRLTYTNPRKPGKKRHRGQTPPAVCPRCPYNIDCVLLCGLPPKRLCTSGRAPHAFPRAYSARSISATA